MELLVVMSIIIILGGLSFSSFGGLQNTIKMNEYVLTLEQDIRSVQRASMLLQRDPNEKWLYGIGIDFGNMGDSGTYTVFKWCSPFNNYGDVMTKSNLPNYKPGTDLGVNVGSELNGYMPNILNIPLSNMCEISATSSNLRTVAGYDKSTITPISTITISSIDGDENPRYVVFESVSGRTFFYNKNGKLLNYDAKGKQVASPGDFVITIVPESDINTRVITIKHLSGKISTESI